jgi:hypothetical protein
MSSVVRADIAYSNPPLPTGPLPRANSSTKLFKPTDIQNCVLWLDANDPSSVQGNPATQWTDKSLGGNSAIATTGPTYTRDSRGRLCMSFTGTQWLESPATVSATTHSLIAVYAPTYINGLNGSDIIGGNSSLFRFQTGASYIVFPYYSSIPHGYITSFGLGVGDSTLVENSVAGTASIINANIAPTSQNIYKNGTQQSSAGTTLTSGTSAALTIGRYTPGLNEYYQGYIYEMIIYSASLTTTQRQIIEGYLGWKWGLQASLDINHPYYKYPMYQLPPFPLFLTVIPRQGKNGKWTPSQLGTLCVWFDASDKYYMTFSGASMTQWTDKSSSALTTTYTGTAPTLGYTNTTTGVPGAITYTSAKTYPGLYFNGATSATTLRTSSLPTTGLTGTTWITIATNLTAPASIVDASLVIATELTSSSPWSSNTEKAIRFDPPGSSFLYTFNGGTNTANSNIFRQDSSAIMNTNGIRGFIDTAAYFTTFQNGVMSLSNTNVATFSPTSNNTLRMGSWSSGYLNGYIFEILIFNTALSLTQYQQAEGYLAWKWGLQGSLPSSHPYSLFPPSP